MPRETLFFRIQTKWCPEWESAAILELEEFQGIFAMIQDPSETIA
jgi:hypothetical protein